MRRLALLVCLWPGAASANGLSTHVWITQAASERVADPELAAFLRDPALQQALVNGTMFPDGGYAADDGYGEIAHWEPYLVALIERLRADHPEPWDDEARRRFAFALGMASHGMADQTFDSMYMARAKVLDADANWDNSFDEATDVIYMSKVGKRAVESRWAPYDLLVELFASAAGHTVSRATVENGQDLVGIAVGFVGLLSSDPDVVKDYAGRFPWGGAHLDDSNARGSPSIEADVVAKYLEVVWARTRGTLPRETAVLETFPADGAHDVPGALDAVESRITIVLSRAHLVKDLEDRHFRLEDAAGREIPVRAWLFYRDHSHVVHLQPKEALDGDYRVTISDALVSEEGTTLAAPYSFAFSTGSAPPPTAFATPLGCTLATGSVEIPIVLAWLAFLFLLRRRCRDARRAR